MIPVSPISLWHQLTLLTTDKSSHFELAYKLYFRELFEGVLVFLEGKDSPPPKLALVLLNYYIHPGVQTGSEWQEARRLLERAFSRDSVVCSLGQVKR